MIQRPKITIIMATYNRAHFIMETLLSIQSQIFKNWECIIVDDGSIDNTRNSLTGILEQDNRFQYFNRPETYQKGLPGCRNFGLDSAKGDFIIFFDDDDIIHPENLQISLESIEKNNSDFCHYQKQPFDVIKPIMTINNSVLFLKTLSKKDLLKVVNQEIGLASCTVLWKKKCFNTIRFNENLMYAEEWECYIRILTDDYLGVIISNVLYFNRKHSLSNTGEFYLNNSIRRESYTEAIRLVVVNLKEKQLLTKSLKRYFITISISFKEFNLFKTILSTLELSTFENLKWKFFKISFPMRMSLYKLKKELQK